MNKEKKKSEMDCMFPWRQETIVFSGFLLCASFKQDIDKLHNGFWDRHHTAQRF